MDVACANSYIAYNMLHPDDLIVPYTSRKGAAPDSNVRSKKAYRCKYEPPEVRNHLLEFQQNRLMSLFLSTGERQKKFCQV